MKGKNKTKNASCFKRPQNAFVFFVFLYPSIYLYIDNRYRDISLSIYLLPVMISSIHSGTKKNIQYALQPNSGDAALS